MDKDQVMSLMSCSVDDNLNINTAGIKMDAADGNMNYLQQNNDSLCDGSLSGWGYWQNYYYPYVVRESYPVYIRERSEDKGKKAFEIIKMLNDLKVTKIEKVKDFIDAMDALIKIL